MASSSSSSSTFAPFARAAEPAKPKDSDDSDDDDDDDDDDEPPAKKTKTKPPFQPIDHRAWSKNLHPTVYTLTAYNGDPRVGASSKERNSKREDIISWLQQRGRSNLSGTKAELLDRLYKDLANVAFQMDAREGLQRVFYAGLKQLLRRQDDDSCDYSIFTASMPRRGPLLLGTETYEWSREFMDANHLNSNYGYSVRNVGMESCLEHYQLSATRGKKGPGGRPHSDAHMDEVRGLLEGEIDLTDLTRTRRVEGCCSQLNNLFEEQI
jgi:hypothetical protein